MRPSSVATVMTSIGYRVSIMSMVTEPASQTATRRLLVIFPPDLFFRRGGKRMGGGADIWERRVCDTVRGASASIVRR